MSHHPSDWPSPTTKRGIPIPRLKAARRRSRAISLAGAVNVSRHVSEQKKYFRPRTIAVRWVPSSTYIPHTGSVAMSPRQGLESSLEGRLQVLSNGEWERVRNGVVPCSAVHFARDRLGWHDGAGLLLQLRQAVLEGFRLGLERFQVNRDFRQEVVERVDEADSGARVRKVGPGFGQESDDIDVAPAAFVQEDARHPGDHARLKLLNPAFVELDPRAVRAPDAPHGRLSGRRHIEGGREPCT